MFNSIFKKDNSTIPRRQPKVKLLESESFKALENDINHWIGTQELIDVKYTNRIEGDKVIYSALVIYNKL